MFGHMFGNARRQQGGLKRHGLISRLSDAVDAYATYCMRRAVPEFELRRVERQISRRQMRPATAH